MKLMVGPNIGNNKVCLNFKKSPAMPDNMPCYEIENSKADEFVSKYNSQTHKLKNRALATMVLGAFTGLMAGLNMTKGKTNRVMKTLLSTMAGTAVGAIVSAIISARMKNKLMDEYNVKKHSI